LSPAGPFGRGSWIQLLTMGDSSFGERPLLARAIRLPGGHARQLGLGDRNRHSPCPRPPWVFSGRGSQPLAFVPDTPFCDLRSVILLLLNRLLRNRHWRRRYRGCRGRCACVRDTGRRVRSPDLCRGRGSRGRRSGENRLMGTSRCAQSCNS
jgi:hypothetical protein